MGDEHTHSANEPRPMAVGPLEQLMSAPACLVYGPPGCGKTTAVTQAARRMGKLVRLTLYPDCDPAEQIASKLGAAAFDIDVLGDVLASNAGELADDFGKDCFLVIDDAEPLLEVMSSTGLKRLSEHDVPNLHLVIVCSSTITAASLRRARTALPCTGEVDAALPPNAAKASWGWAAGASELVCSLGERDDIPVDCDPAVVEFVLARVLDELLWPHLDDQCKERLLELYLDWDESCSTQSIDVKDLPILPATRSEQGKLRFCPAYKRLLDEKLKEMDSQQISCLHAALAKRYLIGGRAARCMEHALAAGDWETIIALDPFCLLYTQDCSKLEDAAQSLLCNKTLLDDTRWKAQRFALRLVAALAIAGYDALADDMYRAVTSSCDDPRARRDLALCSIFMACHVELPLAIAGKDTGIAPSSRSKAFDIDDFSMADIEGLSARLITSKHQPHGQSDCDMAMVLAKLFDQTSMAAFLKGEEAFLGCDFFNAKQRLEHALLSAEQSDCLPMQRATLKLLVELDVIQGNISSANRFLSALEKLPVANERLDDLVMQRCRSFVCVFEGKVDDIPAWLKNGRLRKGVNIAASHWFASFVCYIFYLLKRRRVTKAKTYVEYLADEGCSVLDAAKAGCLDLLQACCELDLGNRETAGEYLVKASGSLEECGVLLPFAAIAALEPRYRAFVTSQAPEITRLMEDNEKTAMEQHVFKKEALSKPSEGLMALLTEREYEVASMAVGGYQNKEIAAKLFITERTVKEHLTRTYKKLGVPDRLALKRLLLTQL